VDARRTPGWILAHHLENQTTELSGNSPSTADTFSHSAEHRLIQLEPGSMPAHNSVR